MYSTMLAFYMGLRDRTRVLTLTQALNQTELSPSLTAFFLLTCSVTFTTVDVSFMIPLLFDFSIHLLSLAFFLLWSKLFLATCQFFYSSQFKDWLFVGIFQDLFQGCLCFLRKLFSYDSHTAFNLMIPTRFSHLRSIFWSLDCIHVSFSSIQ